jgi:hypothetical protein
MMTVEQKQRAALILEKRFIEFLLQFEPMQDIAVGDVKCIASTARTYAFEEFTRELD